MRRSDPIADFLAQLKRQLPAGASGKRRLLKESEQHLDEAVAELEASSVPRAEAQRIAIQRFGSPESLVRQAGYRARSDSMSGSPSARPRRARAMAHAKAPARNYPPVLLAGLVMLLLLAVLPSALNLPQSSPSQTLEYAPVPPEDQDEVAPPAGNFSRLGLGSSSEIGANAAESGNLAGGSQVAGDRDIKSPSTKRCVGNPPRQTEDPESPPCVAVFLGDNGGSTYQGVTRDEIRILFNVEGEYADNCSRSEEAGTRPAGEIFDLALPPKDPETEPCWVEAGRIWQQYFNDRFQTYGRFAHFWMSFGGQNSVEQRRADASLDYERVKPFAVVVQDAQNQASMPYVEVMARKGVMAFGMSSQLPEAVFQRFAGKVWNYYPSLDRQVRQFVDYVCTKVVPFPSSFGGNDGDADVRLQSGQPRRLALLYVESAVATQMKKFALMSREGIRRCGGNFVAEASYPRHGYICCTPANEQAATTAMADFRSKGVTTIIWPQGYAPEMSKAAGRARYLPEWIIADDKSFADLVPAKYQDPVAFAHAVVVTNVAMHGPFRNSQCYQAAHEAAPDLAYADSSIPCRMYDDLRQLFTGIQVAGPRLTPANVEKGFRAIPNRPSGSPDRQACFYEPGDYTCIKDSIAQYWDPQATSTYSSSPGCYRIPQGGRRFLLGEWPQTDVVAERAPSDPCNGYMAGRTLDPSPGPDAPPAQ